jgi:hypothetical protein
MASLGYAQLCIFDGHELVVDVITFKVLVTLSIHDFMGFLDHNDIIVLLSLCHKSCSALFGRPFFVAVPYRYQSVRRNCHAEYYVP